jgi:hypothetical protein
MSVESIQQLIEVEAKKLAETMTTVTPKQGESMYKLGAKLFVRSVTFHYIGAVSFVSKTELVLDNASWVVYSGRFHVALSTGVLDEVEPFPASVSINRETILDASIWAHELPRSAK